MKVDFKKAYDKVSWNAFGVSQTDELPPNLDRVDTGLHFNHLLCSFSEWLPLFFFFPGKRGFRQGDPLSPYLFTIVMEQLSLGVNRAVDDARVVRPNVNPILYISHLCYADGVLLFAGNSKTSAKGNLLKRCYNYNVSTLSQG